LPPGLIEEGRAIPIARVQAMHEGKRRARARRAEGGSSPADGGSSPAEGGSSPAEGGS
jgi:hypothetical protein